MNLLAPFGFLYGQIMQVRNALYDRGVFKSYHLGAKTISVGNITTGGTGKTPLVTLITEILADNGEKVCILTRGYGRRNENERVLVCDWNAVLADAETGGDEPVELARKLLGKAIVVADADRVATAKWAKTEFKITTIVLDDGFQHRRAKRDIDIVCIDATDPFGNHVILPAGKLREHTRNLARADGIVVTRSENVDSIDDLISELQELAPEATIFKAATKLSSPAPSPGAGAFAFCGIGNPASFFSMLTREGFELRGEQTFADHHRYSQKDISEIETEATAKNCQFLVTTAKDAVKLNGLKFDMALIVAEIETVIDDQAGFHEFVLSV